MSDAEAGAASGAKKPDTASEAEVDAAAEISAAGAIDLSNEAPKLAILALTAAGLCYDVGYFAGVDLTYFSIFSFTEHLVFALAAIPFAFIAGVVVLCLVFLHQAIVRDATSPNRHRRILLAEGLVAVAAAPFLHVYGPSSIALGIFFIGAGCLLALYPPFTSRLVISTYVAIGITATAFASGLEQAFAEGFDKHKTDIVQTPEENITGRIIRSGEKRFMFFDADKKRVTVLMWDKVQRLTTTLER